MGIIAFTSSVAVGEQAYCATFLFDMAMIVLFPIMGRALGLSDAAYGLWAGTAVNDTSSVTAAASRGKACG